MINKKHDRQLLLFICLFLALATLLVFWQVKDHDFINYDDNEYIIENPHVQAGLTFENVVWAFTTFHAGNWHPLTWLSHMLDCQLFGLKPGWHHLTNLLFHILNTLLLFLVLHHMTKALWQSTFVAALFALHPLHVESVAWVAERKDVLSTLFWMLTMGAYLFYVERPGLKLYLLTVFFFALGLMAKPMLVTLPFVLLLLDYWPLQRYRLAGSRLPDNHSDVPKDRRSKLKKKKAQKKPVQRTEAEKTPRLFFQWSSVRPLILEKIPFLALSAVSSVLTVYAQKKGGALSSIQALPANVRIDNALTSYVRYIAKMIWPRNLAVFYPHPGTLPVLEVLGAALILVLITFLVIWTAKKFPYLPVGWLWYLGTMILVIGIVQVGAQALADRYTYIPLIGVFIMIVWGLPELIKTWHYQRIKLGILTGFILTMMIIGSWLQVRYWQDSVSIFQHALNVAPQNALAHNNLGTAFREKGNMNEAIFHYMEATRINPKDPKPYYNMGEVLAERGKIKEAVSYFQKALDIKPDFSKAHYNLGLVFMQMGDLERANLHFLETIRIMPSDEEAYLNLGVIMAMRHNYDGAISYFSKALQARPDYAEAHKNLGVALMQRGNLDAAISRLREAFRILPSDPEIPYLLGKLVARRGNFDEAITYFRTALKLKPDYADVHNDLGIALAQKGKLDEAILHFREALRIRPGYREALNNLQVALAQQKDR